MMQISQIPVDTVAAECELVTRISQAVATSGTQGTTGTQGTNGSNGSQGTQVAKELRVARIIQGINGPAGAGQWNAVVSGNITQSTSDANFFEKTSGGSSWNGGFSSEQGFVLGAYVSFFGRFYKRQRNDRSELRPNN